MYINISISIFNFFIHFKTVTILLRKPPQLCFLKAIAVRFDKKPIIYLPLRDNFLIGLFPIDSSIPKIKYTIIFYNLCEFTILIFSLIKKTNEIEPTFVRKWCRTKWIVIGYIGFHCFGSTILRFFINFI